MKILFINNFFSSYGGTETIMYNQASILSQNGHEVFFFATDKGPYFEKNYKYAQFFPKYVDYKSLNKSDALKYLLKPFYNNDAKVKLKAYLDIIKPDIAHCHNICYHLTPSVIEPCKKRNIPVVMTLNDPRLMCPGGTLMYKNQTYFREQYCISGNVSHCILNRCKNNSLKASFIATAENLYNKMNGFYDLIDIFLCPSHAMRNLAINSGINPDKLVVLNNFIKESFLEVKPKYSDKGYFFYAGRLAGEKKINHLIQAMSKLPDIKLHIAGKGPEEKNLKKLTKSLNALNVNFLGFLSGKKLEEEYKNCIATILPCDWFETFGLTIVESYAYGKPVIASKIGAIPELVENYSNGIVFQPGNIDELAASINKLYVDRSFAVEMGKKNREKAVNFFSIETHYKNLINIYDSLWDVRQNKKKNFLTVNTPIIESNTGLQDKLGVLTNS
ncbi:MAG: glycosyltransferase family 4 protein [Candidatus Aenigmarchaeota archaeon]|nr:glycosyltransferase family 4 protein [Candidatus Aenigmarchaeota archaeon]